MQTLARIATGNLYLRYKGLQVGGAVVCHLQVPAGQNCFPHQFSFRLTTNETLKVPAVDAARLDEKERGLLIVRKSDGASILRSEQRRSKICKGIKYVVENGVPGVPTIVWSAKAWLYELERGAHAHVYIEQPHINSMLHGGVVNDQFMKRGLPFWESMLRLWGQGTGHYHRGTKGLQAVARHEKTTLPGAHLAEFTPEACFSAMGTSTSILHSAAPVQAKDKKPGAVWTAVGVLA